MVHRYHLEGKSKGKLEVFIDNLPGLPDNIRSNSRGGYWIALFIANVNNEIDMTKTLDSYPVIRKALARMVHIAESTISLINKLFSSTSLAALQRKVRKDLQVYPITVT